MKLSRLGGAGVSAPRWIQRKEVNMYLRVKARDARRKKAARDREKLATTSLKDMIRGWK